MFQYVVGSIRGTLSTARDMSRQDIVSTANASIERLCPQRPAKARQGSRGMLSWDAILGRSRSHFGVHCNRILVHPYYSSGAQPFSYCTAMVTINKSYSTVLSSPDTLGGVCFYHGERRQTLSAHKHNPPRVLSIKSDESHLVQPHTG